MSNVRDYLRKRAERKENKQTAKNVGNLIIKHRMAIISRTILVILLCAALGATIYVQLKNQVFTSYVTLSSVDKQQYDNAVCLNYEKGFLTYSKDGISYTDNKGNAIWNQTFEMQDPMVRIARTRVAVADYNGHIIHNIALSGDAVEIDTNLPIRQFALAENGMVAAILEDTNITWIYLYNSAGEKVAYIKTTMQKSGYPAAVALSPDGKLMAVSYITVESGAAKSSVAFYNFSSVGQNFVDNFASGADYVDAVIPYLTFINGDTAFAVADNRLVIYSGDQRPKSTADVSLVLSILKPVLEIAEALLGGALLGVLFTVMLRFFKVQSNRMVLAIAFVLVTSAVANALNISALLTTMAMGAVFANLCKNSSEVMSLCDHVTPPVFMMFFVLSGAGLNLAILPSIGVVGVIYVVLRVMGKMAGAWFGATVMKADHNVRRWLGPALIPQAGVAIGLTVVAQQVVPQYAEVVRAVVLCGTLIYELVGPGVAKWTLQKAGEIEPGQ